MKLHIRRSLLAAAVLAALPLAAQVASPSRPLPVAKAIFNPNTIAWTPQVAYRSATLRIVGPGGFVTDRDFGNGKPVFELSEMPYLADGKYVYEIVLGQVPDEALAKAVSRAEFAEDGTVKDAGLAARMAALRATFSGTFTIADGKIVSPYLVEPTAQASAKVVLAATGNGIIRDSLCVGIDCLDIESFGFDTIRLKENNIRIGFADTSVSPFPANAWQLTANDSASGGANKFSIEDITNARVPFTTTAGAPTNSLFIDSGGRVGFRTATPVLDLHARTGNTPAIRLEQDSSGGFTAQTWDIGANEANFFVRDVTGGSRHPFRIRPGAPTSSIDIAASGNVGIGTGSPSAKVHVVNPFAKTDTAARSLAWFASSDGSNFSLLNLYTVGAATQPGRRWGLQTQEIGVANTGSLVLQEFGGLVGIGTIPRPWTGATPVALQLRQAGLSANSNGTATYLSTNAYFDGGTWRTVNTGDGAVLALEGGALSLYSAAGGIPETALPITNKLRVTLAGDVGIGTTTPLAKLHVEGNARINGSLVVTGPCCGPDYVFSPGFKLASIEENAAYMWKNRHLPAVGPAKTTDDGRAVVNVFSQSNGMLEELEKAHIYIEQLHKEIKSLKAEAAARDAEVREELAELRRLVGK